MFGNLLGFQSLDFHGIHDIHNRKRLLGFLQGLDKDALYTIREYDIHGNLYHSGPKVVNYDELQRLSHYAHVSHRYQILDQSGNEVCSIALAYPSLGESVPKKVDAILH